MEVIKSFISHLLAFIFFVALIFLSATFLVKNLLSRDQIYKTLEESEIYEEIINDKSITSSMKIPSDLLNYVKLDDIFYNYATDRFLYEATITKDKPTIDLKVLNERLAVGVEDYIDAKVIEYTGAISSWLKDLGLDLKIEEQVKEYLEHNSTIDFSKNQYISEKDLDDVYKAIDDALIDVKESTYVFDILEIIYNNNYQMLAIGVMIGSLLLIALINFNVISIFAYTIAPFIVTSIIYFILYIVAKNIDFSGNVSVKILNILIDDLSVACLKYFVIFIVLCIVCGFLYYIIKHLNIAISHRSGVATLDTVFDDYNREDVVKEITDRENDSKEEKPKRGRKKKSN